MVFLLGCLFGFLSCAWLCADLLKHKGLFTEDWKIVNLRAGEQATTAPGAAKLFVQRFYEEHEFDFATIQEAASDALAQLDGDLSFPGRIEVDGEVVWQLSDLPSMREQLEQLAV